MRRAWLAIALVASCAHAMHKRALPDYDGRDHHESAGRALLRVPRVIVALLYFTAEYLIRRPIGLLVRTAEANHLPTHFLDFFTSETHDVGLVPTAFYEAGFSPSIGQLVYWNHFLVKESYLHLHIDVGARWFYVTANERVDLDKRTSASVGGGYTDRDDHLFYGLGPRSIDANESRYASTVLAAWIALLRRLPLGSSAVELSFGVRKVRFGDDGCCDEPTLQQNVDAGVFAMPPGFRSGYADAYERLVLTLDSRPLRTFRLTGARASFYFDENNDLQGSLGHWIRYGGTAGVFWDIWRHRVLGLVADVELADGVGDGVVPFTEMPVYGGWGPMRGLRPGRAIGPSAAALTLEYEWPVWVWLDGTAHVGIGNVFDNHLEGFNAGDLRLSTGIGLRTNTSPDNKLEVLLGFGTEAFADGARFTSFRLFVGATHGF